MEDRQIVDLYWARSESAIEQSDRKYGKMLTGISTSLVPTLQDAQECVNDTYLAAWNSMPTERPIYLGAFLSKLTRRISISRYRTEKAKKRGGADVFIDELTESVPSDFDLSAEYENQRLADALNRFLFSLDEEKRYVFIRRYYYSDPMEKIARELSVSLGKIKSMLFRLRNSLREFLEKEDFAI